MLKICLGKIVLTLCLLGVESRSNAISKEFFTDTSETNDISILDYDLDGAIQRLSGAIKFETVSTAPGKVNATELLKFHEYLEKSFPKVHSTSWIEKQVINLSLVYIVKPRDSSNASDEPWILQGHQDVVPITDSHKWTALPFGGQILYRPDDEQPSEENSTTFEPGQPQNSDWFVYGRGTIDCKHLIMASLEALEHMIGLGLRPRTNTLVLSYTHDEESGGNYGAKAVAQYLKERFQTHSIPKPFTFLLDEGFNMIEDVLPQNAKLAPIGIGEKTSADVTMTVETSPGHSSIPPKENAISILAEAITRIQAFEFPSLFGAPGTPDIEICRRIASLFPNNRRILLLNADLFTNEIPLILDQSDLASALIRTTKAVTLINGGVKNIVPSLAQANINHRIHPLQTPAQILDIDIAVVNDSRVHFELTADSSPQPISEYNSTAFANLETLITQLFGEGSVISSNNTTTIVVPAIVTGGTDSKHFGEIVQNVYRFSLISQKSADTSRYHGIDERISFASFDNCVNFYYRLMEKVSGLVSS